MSNAGGSPYVLRQGEGKELPLLGLLKASGAATGDAFEVIEYEGPLQPPPHVHREREEAFYILDGTFTFLLGQDEFTAEKGALVFIPRGTRHGFKTGEGGRAVLFVCPAGLEGFFEELGTGVAEGRSSQELRDALAGRYDSFPG